MDMGQFSWRQRAVQERRVQDSLERDFESRCHSLGEGMALTLRFKWTSRGYPMLSDNGAIHDGID